MAATDARVKKRPRVDRNAPKAFKNAYLHFAIGKRTELTTLQPDWSVQQVSAEIGRQWKALAPLERKPWIELAQFDRARFQTELEQYMEKKRVDEAIAKVGVHPAATSLSQLRTRIHIPFKRKKGKKEPKQPDTAYICFWKSKRMELLNDNPHMEATLVSKEVGRQWKALAEPDRQIWKDMAATDRARYYRELAEYEQPAEELLVYSKPIKDPYAPKPAKTGFQLFMSHNRESFTLLNMTINEFRVEMSQLWKRLNDEDKSVWYAMAKQDQLRYEAEVNAYKPPAYMSTNALRAQKRLEDLKRAARSDPNAPRLPMTAYSFYLSVKRHQIQLERPDLKHNSVMREVGIAWKALTVGEKTSYMRKAKCDVERFEKEMEVYLATDQSVNNNSESDKFHQSSISTMRNTKKKRKTSAFEQDAVVKEGTTKKRKKQKKLMSPRRPQTAYNLMYMSKRAELLAAFQMSHNECSALCGRMWRQMTDTERDPYHRMALEDKQRYESEMKEYMAQLKQLRDEETEARQCESRGFRYFLSAKRRESEGLSLDEIASIWNSMSEPHQTLWEELAVDHEEEDQVDELEEQRQLEESALMILGTRDVVQQIMHDDGDDTDSPEMTNKRFDREQKRTGNLTSGFRYYVDSKKAERERWTHAMWVKDWESKADSYRALWEEVASENSVDVIEEEQRRVTSDLETDVLCGFVSANGNAPVNAFV